MSEDYDLGKSEKAIGKLYPILKDAQGNIIDGFHRQNSNPDWPSITLDSVDTPQKLELARLTANFCRRNIPASEIENRITFLIKSGMKPEEIAEQTGISKTTIYKYMPQELKDITKVEAGIASGIARTPISVPPAEHTVTTQDTSPLTIQDTVKCERCGVNTSQPKTWHGHQLCPKHFELANLNPEAYDGYLHTLTREKNGEVPVLPKKPQETAEYRKAVMSPDMSKMETLFDEEAQKLGIHGIRIHPEIPIITTTPDRMHVETNTLFFLDGSQVHKGKRLDKDEKYREILRRRGFKTEVLRYDRPDRGKMKEFLEKWQSQFNLKDRNRINDKEAAELREQLQSLGEKEQ
jgi:hypothetical protein